MIDNEKRRKNVLYLSYDGMTDPLGQSQVIPYLKGLSPKGYHFTILSFEKEKQFREKGAKIASLLDEAGIEWVTATFSNKVPLLSKVYDQRRMIQIAIRLHRSKKFDLLHCRSYVAAEAGKILQEKFGVPFLFDMRGFWVDERVDNSQWDLKKSVYRWLYNRYKKKEQEYFSAAKHIISLTHKGKEELTGRYRVPENKVTVIPCCADLDHFDYRKITEAEQLQARTLLGISPDDVIITYLGSLGGWYMTSEMLSFFNLMSKQVPRLKFLFITHDTWESVAGKAEVLGINPDSIIVKPANRSEVPLLLSLSTWSIFFIKDAYSKKASSPTKQGEIMAMGIPLVCNDIGDTGRIVMDTNAGVLVNGFSDEAYGIAIREMLAAGGVDKGSIRRGAFKYYNLEDGVGEYERVYLKMINPPL